MRAATPPLTLLLLLGLPPAAVRADAREAIVKVYAAYATPDFEVPWSPGLLESGIGSGALLRGGRILTAAHVIADATFLEVRRHGDTERHAARVEHVSHDADLALLALVDGDAFPGVSPLEPGALPHQGDEVIVYGFPDTGDSLSLTRGVVSRIEHTRYVHSDRSLLAAQIDAAVNPGNSGGPVLREGRIVGVVTEKATDAEATAFMVPAPAIERFLADVEDGRYDGIPGLGVEWQPAENRDLRRRYAIPEGRGGVLLTRVHPGSAGAAVLEPGDVLLGLGGVEIGADGTVELRRGERTAFSWLVEQRQQGDTLDAELLRGGAFRHETVGLDAPADAGLLIPARRFGCRPRYLVWGGVVFVPLGWRYLETWTDWWSDAPDALTRQVGRPAPGPGEERVVLHQVLPAPINEGYHELAYRLVESVDGQRVRSLEHLAQLLDEGRGRFATVIYDESLELVLERAEAGRANGEILERYGIPRDRRLEACEPVGGAVEPR